MSCSKNPKRFLGIFKYKGEHDMKAVRFGRFMIVSRHFKVLVECQLCGIQEKRPFVSEEELLKMGVTVEEIAKHRNTIY